jgi:hypothetical protein
MEQTLQRGLSMEQEHKPRTSMILLLEHVHAMDELTNEEFGAFIRNYAQYVETGLEPAYDNDRAMRMLWKVVKAFDDMNVQKMEERDRRRREANKKNINKRWNDKKYESIPMVSQDTNGINGIPNIPTDTNGSLSVSDSVSESDKKEKCEKKNTNEVKRFKAPTVEQTGTVGKCCNRGKTSRFQAVNQRLSIYRTFLCRPPCGLRILCRL